jgi:putative addiction module component (TIGR02574 family)
MASRAAFKLFARRDGRAYFSPMQLTPDEISRLSPNERLALIAQLWDSLKDDQIPLTTAQQAELERRLTRLDHDRAQSVTWETLKAEVAQRCP